MIKKIRAVFTRKIILSVAVVAVLGGIIAYKYSGANNNAVQTITVTRGDIAEEVNVTGKTKPVSEVMLAFERSGRIVNAYVDVGSRVARGQSLIALDQSELTAQREQAAASVLSAQAKLDGLKRGPLPEDIQVAQTQLQEAKQTLDNDYSSVPNLLQDAYTSATNAIRKDVDSLFINDESSNVSLSFQTANSQKANDTLSARYAISAELNSWNTELNILDANTDPAVFDAALNKGTARLTLGRNLLDSLNNTVLGLIGSTSTMNAYLTADATARGEINREEFEAKKRDLS